MIGRIKLKMILVSVMIAVISGIVAGTTVACVENRGCIAKKCKKAFKELENKMT